MLVEDLSKSCKKRDYSIAERTSWLQKSGEISQAPPKMVEI